MSKQLEKDHNIPLGIGGPDISENMNDFTHEEHLIKHKVLKILPQDSRDFRSVENNPKNIIPTNDYFEYKEGLWLKAFKNIELLEEEILLKVMRSLEATKNVYRRQAGLTPEEVNSYNYYEVSRQIIIDTINAQKLIVKKALKSTYNNLG